MQTLLSLDKIITDFLYFEGATQTLKNATYIIASSFVYLVPIILLVMFFRSHRDRIASMKIFTATVIAWQGLTGVIGSVLYSNYGFRDRPFAEGGLTEWFLEQPEKAFPSDHAAVLIVVALSLFLYKYPKLGYLFLIGGIVSSLARIVIGFHWFGDVLGGWLIGIGVVGIFWVFDKQLTTFFEWLVQRFSRQYGKR